MSSKPQVSTQTSTPLSGAQNSLFGDIWGNTQSSLNSALSTPIPQNTVAGPTAAQQSGVNQMLSAAPGLGAGAPSTMDLLKKIASGFFTNPQNDPNFQGALTAALQPGLRTLKENILPGITDTSIRASGGGTGPAAYGGVGGGSPEDISKERALRDWSLGAQDTGARMAEDIYKQGLGLFSQIPGLAQSATTQALTPAAVTSAAGGMQQGWDQGALQNLINRYQMMTQGPLSLLSSAANVGAAGGFGNKTLTGPTPNLATQWLQGLTGGVAGLNSLFGGGPGGAPSAAQNMWNMGTNAYNWLTG